MGQCVRMVDLDSDSRLGIFPLAQSFRLKSITDTVYNKSKSHLTRGFMSQKDQGNKQSMAGEYKGHGKREASKVESDMVGSSDANGIRFGIPNHPDKSDLSSPEKD